MYNWNMAGKIVNMISIYIIEQCYVKKYTGNLLQ